MMNSTEQSSPQPENMLLIGLSHTVAVQRAAKLRKAPVEVVNFWQQKEVLDETEDLALFAEPFARRLESHVGPLFCIIGGFGHVSMGLLVHREPFDFVLPSEPELPLMPGATILPSGAVRRAMMEVERRALRLVYEAARLSDGPIFHFAAPPVLENVDRGLKRVLWDWFPDSTDEVAPAIFRYKLWRMECELLASVCADVGVTFIEAPERGFDPESPRYLRPDLDRDGLHANHKYGRLILEQMRSIA